MYSNRSDHNLLPNNREFIVSETNKKKKLLIGISFVSPQLLSIQGDLIIHPLSLFSHTDYRNKISQFSMLENIDAM